MKRIIGIWFLCFMFCCGLSGTVSAQETASVFAEAVSAPQNGTLAIPIQIQDNPGLMGFKITISFPETCAVTDVQRGTVTANGNFNSNPGLYTNHVDIVWNGTEDNAADGTLFVIQVQTKQLTDSAQMEITYSTPDTFNAAWQDVVLECTPIILTAANPSAETENESVSETAEEITENTKNSQSITEIVETALQTFSYETLQKAHGDPDFFQYVQKELQNLPVPVAVEDFSELQEIYETARRTETTAAVYAAQNAAGAAFDKNRGGIAIAVACVAIGIGILLYKQKPRQGK